jgi:hypothetical protein
MSWVLQRAMVRYRSLAKSMLLYQRDKLTFIEDQQSQLGQPDEAMCEGVKEYPEHV